MFFLGLLAVQVTTYVVLAGVFVARGDLRFALAQLLIGATQAIVFSRGLA
jgi:hypothetical protein